MTCALAHIVARDHARLLRLFGGPAVVLDWQHLHTTWYARRGGKRVLNEIASTIEWGGGSGGVELEDARVDAWRLTEAGRAAWAARRSMDDEIAGSVEAR